MIRSLLLIIGISLAASTVARGNAHEHLYYQPSYSDFLLALNQLATGKSIQTSVPSAGTPAYDTFIKQQEALLFSNEFLVEKLRKFIIKNALYVSMITRFKGNSCNMPLELVRTISFGHYKKFSNQLMLCKIRLSDLFEIKDVNYGSVVPEKAKEFTEIYKVIGTIRTHFFENAGAFINSHEPKQKQDFILSVFDQYARRIESTSRLPVIYTHKQYAPDEIYDAKLLSRIYQRIEGVTEPQSVTLISLTRNQLSLGKASWDSTFEQAKEQIRELKKNGLRFGFDITGSLSEGRTEETRMTERYLTRLTAVYDYLLEEAESPQQCIFRFHGFETNNQGSLYTAFRQLLKEKNREKVPIRIGHLSYMSESDFEFLATLPNKKKLSFDVNLFSNLTTTGKTSMELAYNVWNLERLGFRTEFGTDGAGILNFELVEQLCYLFKNLKDGHMMFLVNAAVRAMTQNGVPRHMRTDLNNGCKDFRRYRQKLGDYLFPYLKLKTEFCAAQMMAVPPEFVE